MIDKYPAFIARCANVEDVICAVNFAREHTLLVADPAASAQNIEWTGDFWHKMQPFAKAGI